MIANLPEIHTRTLDEITPYWRNPRRISDEAVEAVAESIRRYGYQQPIVVDSDNVIVVGHTRYAALKSLGVSEVPVYVTDLPASKVSEYRLVDNRTGEMSEWDHEALVLELREWEEGLLESFFPDLDLEIGQITDAVTTDAEVDAAVTEVTRIKDAAPVLTTDVVCPACFHSFKVRTDSLPGLSRNDLAAMTE